MWMNWLDRMNAAVDYMEENIDIGSNIDPLEVDDINNPMQPEV